MSGKKLNPIQNDFPSDCELLLYQGEHAQTREVQA